jgi:hypothetical protein
MKKLRRKKNKVLYKERDVVREQETRDVEKKMNKKKKKGKHKGKNKERI